MSLLVLEIMIKYLNSNLVKYFFSQFKQNFYDEPTSQLY